MTELSEITQSPFATASITSLESLLSPPAAIAPTQKFLRFRLDRSQSMLLPVEEIAAVRTLPISEILPVPQMSACVLGLFNWRGEAIWLVDLAQQIGFSAIAQLSQRITLLTAIIVQSDGKFLGLIVPEIYEIEEHNPDMLLISSPDLFPQQASPFIQGYFKHDRSIVLSASAAIRDPSLQIHHLNSL